MRNKLVIFVHFWKHSICKFLQFKKHLVFKALIFMHLNIFPLCSWQFLNFSFDSSLILNWEGLISCSTSLSWFEAKSTNDSISTIPQLFLSLILFDALPELSLFVARIIYAPLPSVRGYINLKKLTKFFKLVYPPKNNSN